MPGHYGFFVNFIRPSLLLNRSMLAVSYFPWFYAIQHAMYWDWLTSIYSWHFLSSRYDYFKYILWECIAFCEFVYASFLIVTVTTHHCMNPIDDKRQFASTVYTLQSIKHLIFNFIRSWLSASRNWKKCPSIWFDNCYAMARCHDHDPSLSHWQEKSEIKNFSDWSI